MKPILLILLALSSHSLFSQSQYSISLTAPGADSKMYLSAIEDHIPDTYARSTADNIIQFSASTNYSVSYVDSICRISGIPFENIVKTKGPIEIREKVGGTNCGVAEQICSNTSLPGNSSGYGIQELDNVNSGCLGVEHQSSWYYINVEVGGSLSFRINPNANSDYDFALWGPFTSANAAANCPPVAGPTRCSFAQGNGNTGMRVGESDNSEGSSGDRWINALNVSANQIYILLIDNYSASGIGYTFDFNWGGNSTTAVIGCTPVILPVEMSDFYGTSLAGSNVLSWSTETELNNDYFEIEWTTTPSNNNSWNKLDLIDGAGDSQSEINYSINHYTYTRNTINYYRIKQVDYNGQTRAYPEIIAIDNRMKDQKLVKVVNLMGQEVSESEKGLVIYVYDDGTTEKHIN